MRAEYKSLSKHSLHLLAIEGYGRCTGDFNNNALQQCPSRF